MLYLAIIGIVCAVSAPKDGIPQIGEKNYKSNSHYQFDEGGQTPIEQILPRLRNGTSVCYTKSANANDSNRTSSNLNCYFKNQCSVNKRNSSYSLVENLDTKEISNSFSIFKKRNLLWFEKNNREKMKKSHSTLSLKPQKNRETAKLRKKNGKIYAKRKNKRRSLDKIKVDEEVDIRKQIQNLVKKIAANNILREESSRVDVQKVMDQKRDENSNGSRDKRQKKKISDTEGEGGGSIRIKLFPETESVVVKFGNNDDKMKLIMPTCSYSGKSARKARFRRNPRKSLIARGGSDYKKTRYYRNVLDPLPHPRVVNNNFHSKNFALNKRNLKYERKSRYKNKLDLLKRRLKKRSCFKLPKIGGRSETHHKKSGGTDDVENKKFSENGDVLHKKVGGSDDMDLKKISVSDNTDYRKKMKELLDESDDHSANDNASKNYGRPDDEDKVKKKEDQKKEETVFQKPFLPSIKDKFEENIPLNDDRSLIPRSATKSKLLANNKNLTPERYLKIRHALRSYLIENDAWGPNQRDSFVEKRRRFKKGCSMPHKCWRAAPLLCIPYIRKGQDEMLKYIIKNLQKMLGKPFTRKIDIFEKTKFKPHNVKPPPETSDDIIPGENEEECTTKNPCCSTTVCVPTTCPPTTTCPTTTTTCRTTSTCAITPSSEVTCGKGFTFPLTTSRNSIQETTLAPSATLPAPPLSSTKSFFNMNTKTLPAYNTPRFSPRPIPLMTTPMSRTALAVSMRMGQFATTSRPLRVPNQPLLNTARAVSFACADSCPFDFSKAPIRQDEYYLFDPITEEDIEPSKNPLETFDPQQNLMNHFKNQVNGFRTTPQWLHRLLNPAAFKQSMSYEDKETDKFNPTPELDNQFMQEIQNQPYFAANSFRPKLQKHDMNQWMMQLKRPQQESAKYGFQPIMEFFPAYDYDIVDKYPYMKYNMRYNKYRYPWLFHKNYGVKMKSSIGKSSKNQELKRQKRSADWAPPSNKEKEYDDDFKDDEDSLERPQAMNPKLKTNWRNINLFRKSATTPVIFEMFSNLAMQISNTEVNKEGTKEGEKGGKKGGKESKKSGKKSKSTASKGGKTPTSNTATKKHKSKSDESKNSGTTTVIESKGTTDTENGTESTVTDSETTANLNKTVSPSTIITTNNACTDTTTSACTIASTNASSIANIFESTTASTLTTLTTMTKPSTEGVNLTTLVQGLTKSNATTSSDENKSTDINLKSKSMSDSNTTELTVNVKSAGSLSNTTSSNTSNAMLNAQSNTSNNSSTLNATFNNTSTNGSIINTNSTTNTNSTGSTTNNYRLGAVTNATIDTATSLTDIGRATNATGIGSATNSSDMVSATNATAVDSATNTSSIGSVTNTSSIGSATNATGMVSATNATGIGSATNATGIGSATNATGIGSATNATGIGSATNATGTGSATNTTGIGSATNTTGIGSATNTTGIGSATNTTDTGSTTNTSGAVSTPSTIASNNSNAFVTTISSNVGNVTNITISSESTRLLGSNISTESINASSSTVSLQSTNPSNISTEMTTTGNVSSEITDTATCPTSTEEECATTPTEEPKGTTVTVAVTGNNTLLGAGNSTVSGIGNNTLLGTGNSTITGTGNNTISGTGNNTISGTGNNTFLGTGNSTGIGKGIKLGFLNSATTENPLNNTSASIASNDTNIPKTETNTTSSLTDSQTTNLPTCITMDTQETARTYKNKKKSKASGASRISSSQLKKSTTNESTTPGEDEDTGCPEACPKDKKEEGFTATTLKAASIVKGPKLIATKPAPRMFAKVYPETYPNSARNTENIPNDLGQTTVAPLKSILEKAILQPTTVAPDVRLQLLPVCEGYLEVVKLIKAQNQSLAAELDSELSQFCENIISQSFNLPEGNLPKKTYELYPYAINGTYPVEMQQNQRELTDDQPMTTREYSRKTGNIRGEPEISTRKKMGQKRIDEVLKDYVDREERKRLFQVNITTTPIEGIEKRIRRKHEVSFEEMSRKHKETLDLLKKRKRELLKWLMNSQEKHEDGLYPEEAEYMEDYEMTRTTVKEVSGKVNHNGDEETFELPTSVASYPKINQISYPVYAKKYGYDKPGDLREVELIWRKVNRDTQEKELLKNESVMAFLYTPSILPYINYNEKNEDEDLYEGQSNRNGNVLFTDIHVSVGKPVSIQNFTTEYNILTDLNKTKRFNHSAATKRPNATVTVHHNVTFLNPNMTRKIIKKAQEAKGKLQEYGIEFLNYAVYILPIMFSLLFLICCSCWFFDWWRRKHKNRRRKRKSKKELVSMTDTDTSEQSEPRKKKKRRKRVEKEVDEDGSEGTKKYKRFWNPLKYQKGDYHDDNSVDNKFLRFLKMKKDRELETHPKSEARRSRIREAERNLDSQERKKEEARSLSTSKSRSASRERDSDNRDRVNRDGKHVSSKLMKKKEGREFVKPDEESEGNDRREIIALLDELKDIEMQQLGEKPTVIGYMTSYGSEKSGFDYSGFPMSYPREKYFPTLRASNPFCEKHFRLPSREGSPAFENDEIANDNLDELEQLLPCKCNRYAIKNDFVRRPQYQISKTGKCESYLKVFRDSCMPESKNLYKKELKLFKDRSVYVNRYKSVSTETNDELLVGKECDPRSAEFGFTDNLLDELIPRKAIGFVSEKRQFSKKKCVRLKEGGVLCRL